MTRARPVHRLSAQEQRLAAAIAPAHEHPELRHARKLKQAIEEHWRSRGYEIDVRIVEALIANGLNDTQNHRVYVLASRTINGMPVGAPP